MKLTACCILVLSIFIFLATITTAQSNDTWYDSHWGGDTGEETYHDPLPQDETRNEEDDGGICSSVILFGMCIPAITLYKREAIKNKIQEVRIRIKLLFS